MHAARFLAPILALLLSSSTFAHGVAVNLSVLLQNKNIVVLASSIDGYPIQGATMEYLLVAEDGTTYRSPLKERAESEYAAPQPSAKPGQYQLLIRDSTFPRETLEVKKVVAWPLVESVQMLLPPNTPPGPNIGVLFALIGLPVVLAFGVLLWAIARRNREQRDAPNAGKV